MADPRARRLYPRQGPRQLRGLQSEAAAVRCRGGGERAVNPNAASCARSASVDPKSRRSAARPRLPPPVLRETRAELATAREAGGGEGLPRAPREALTLSLSRITARAE